MALTAREKNRQIRKDAMREQLKNQKLIESTIKISQRLYDECEEIDTATIQSLKASADINLKLINKYLPDLKSVEMSGPEDENGLPTQITFNVVTAKPD